MARRSIVVGSLAAIAFILLAIQFRAGPFELPLLVALPLALVLLVGLPVAATLAIDPVTRWLAVATERRVMFVGGVLALIFLVWRGSDGPDAFLNQVINSRVRVEPSFSTLLTFGLEVFFVWIGATAVAYALLPVAVWLVGNRAATAGPLGGAVAEDRPAEWSSAVAIGERSEAGPATDRECRTVRMVDGRFALRILAFDTARTINLRTVAGCSYDALDRCLYFPTTREAAGALRAFSRRVDVFYTSDASSRLNELDD